MKLLLALFALQSPPPELPRVPFAAGERFEYVAKFGILTVGSAAIEVAPPETLRGDSVYRFRFSFSAKVPFYSIESTLDSWTRVRDFESLRFRRDNLEKGRRFLLSWEILGDSGYYRQVDPEPKPSAPTASDPLDDAAFLFFVRTVPLELGKTYSYDRYFRPDRNPIQIRVLKRETMELPDGSKVPCLVLNPVIGESGLFAKRADARLWITDDARRIPVQIRSRYSFGTVTLKLERIGGPSRS
jgi:hypothetical protein